MSLLSGLLDIIPGTSVLWVFVLAFLLSAWFLLLRRNLPPGPWSFNPLGHIVEWQLSEDYYLTLQEYRYIIENNIKTPKHNFVYICIYTYRVYRVISINDQLLVHVTRSRCTFRALWCFAAAWHRLNSWRSFHWHWGNHAVTTVLVERP